MFTREELIHLQSRLRIQCYWIIYLSNPDLPLDRDEIILGYFETLEISKILNLYLPLESIGVSSFPR